MRFILPNMQAGEYTLYARTYDSTGSGKMIATVNNINPIYDISFTNTNKAYSSHPQFAVHEIAKLKITRNGDSSLKFSNVPKSCHLVRFDFFYLIKTADLTPEPQSNYEISEYPAMDKYEVKTVLNTFDDYICGADSRYYQNKQVYGYKGDGNAFNLNSRGTLNTAWFDNNGIVSGAAGFLDGDGLRFWYKASSNATLQFKAGGATKYNKTLPANSGGWVTIYYTELTENSENSENITSQINITGFSGKAEIINISEKIDESEVKKITEGSFAQNNVITSVILPTGVKIIEKSAFSGCTSLENITMNGVTIIGDEAFSGCTALETVNLISDLQTIGNKAFFNCKKLQSFYFADSITSIGENSFMGCDIIAEMTKQTYIAQSGYVFDYVNNHNITYYPFTESAFSYSVVNHIATIVGYSGNYDLVIIPSVIDGYDVECVGRQAFKNTAVKKVSFTGNVRKIDEQAFYNCTLLQSVIFADSLRSIEGYAFAYCVALKSVNLNDVVTVSSTAFFGSPTAINYEKKEFIRNAYDYVDGMTAGWNLGNTLESYNANNKYGDVDPLKSETLWGAPVVTQELINMVAEKFNTIRIPITWDAFIDTENGYKIDKAYMDRVEEVVNYAYKSGFKYIIINVHQTLGLIWIRKNSTLKR